MIVGFLVRKVNSFLVTENKFNHIRKIPKDF